MKLLSGLALAALLAAPAVRAAPQTLEITRAWSRPAVAGTNGVGYLTVVNHAAKADAVVAVESPLAARVDLHSMSLAGGVMSMQKVDRIAVPAGGRAEIGPPGYHLMLMDLKRTLKVGDRVPATVTFASGARLKTSFIVALTAPAS